MLNIELHSGKKKTLDLYFIFILLIYLVITAKMVAVSLPNYFTKY